ncbi:uncharacterized protein LOC127738707 [Mytilus californianus]|uniref:uncharacterized protein LOC127738707 n=1 Tax=Mytilus californianus TaxID=6549 RepID=UPI0022462A05|nr:uncharacterized protein LOC127738707 [Mytilus californianus]
MENMTLISEDWVLDRITSSKIAAPPVNNACLPDIYNKLDADTIEKTRVINKLLEQRLKLQEKIINKYQVRATVVHKNEKARVRKDLKKIRNHLPNMDDMVFMDTQMQLKTLRKKHHHVHTPTGYTTTPMEMKGLASEKDDNPFCSRFYIHHMPVKSRTKPVRMARYIPGRSKDRSRGLELSRVMSASENCLVSGMANLDLLGGSLSRTVDDDDAMTV